MQRVCGTLPHCAGNVCLNGNNLGAAAAAAIASEDTFNVIRIFERREVPGGTWYVIIRCSAAIVVIRNSRIYDADPGEVPNPCPGKLPFEVDPPLEIPDHLPQERKPIRHDRWDKTPIYADLTFVDMKSKLEFKLIVLLT